MRIDTHFEIEERDIEEAIRLFSEEYDYCDCDRDNILSYVMFAKFGDDTTYDTARNLYKTFLSKEAQDDIIDSFVDSYLYRIRQTIESQIREI